MAWLDDHPPAIQQFRCPRRRSPSGIIGVHTAESFPDETGPDTGAENVADFIQRRTNYGSYHLLADSDSIIHLVRFECVAYHIATHSLNEHTIGVSAATQAAKWNSLSDDWVDATVRNMARASAIAARWLKSKYGITVPAKRLTLSQALDGQKGFLAHGDADSDRRSDPGSTFPWGQFLSNYSDEMEDDMPTAKEIAVAVWTEALFSEVSNKAVSAKTLLQKAHLYSYGAERSIQYPLGSADGPTPRQAWSRAEARTAALLALVAEIIDRDPSTPLTGDQVKTIVEKAIQDNVVKVDVTIEGVAPEPDDT